MAKELPYFKFFVSEWNDGRIVDCSMEAQGLFINICSLYWSRLGNLDDATAMRKLCQSNAKAYKELKSSKIIKVLDKQISIDFLDEQLGERKQVSDEARKRALLRWEKQKPDAYAMPTHSPRNANAMQIREEEKREDKKVDHALASNVFSFLQRKGSNTSEVNYMVLQWQKEGVTDIMEQLKAMKEYYKREGLTFPTKIDTIRQSLPSADWIQKIRESNPVQYGKPADPDTIGTSAPGSLE